MKIPGNVHTDGGVMAVINITAFFLCLFILSCLWKKSPVEVFPVLFCILTLALYALAFMRHLSWIDGVGIGVLAAFVIVFLRWKKEKRSEFVKTCLKNMTQPSFIAAVVLILIVTLCTSQKVVTWWDDINFWATDVKSLYYLDGFAAKYGNVAPEFGDYPPGGQLIKWWFLHFEPHVFREGLAFAGYYVMNLVFMMPLFIHIKGKNVLVFLGMALSLWCLPSIAEVYGYDGFCADLTMACIYGGFLYAVTDRAEKPDSFYYIRLALYLAVLVLIKSVGFIWAAFGLVFVIVYRWNVSAMDGEKTAKKDRLKAGLRVLSPGIAPLITGGSWMLFCLMMRRVTKTTATAVKYMTTDEYGISGYTKDFAKAFLEAFAFSPLHKEKTPVLDVTPLGFYVIVCALVIFFFRKKLLPEKAGKVVLCFSVISGAVFYAVIFLAHITIFAMETQYLEASGMISSIERYGAPFTIGTLIFLANIWLKCGGRLWENAKSPFLRQYGVYLCFLFFITLTAGWRTAYDGLIGYRADVTADLAQREDMIDEDAAAFLQTIQILGMENSTRVCYIQRDDTPRWVKNSYTNMEASPVSVVYKSVNLNDAVTDWMAQELRDSHAEYLYVEETDADVMSVFLPMMEDASAVFSCGMLYRIADDGAQIHLTLVSY
ncbi:MAG: hypothetical protein NC231_11010 [Bacillus sp. (in: Bacteria)]|nr:hypothetical protein [Bacillus sp. (in: firmicutes)]MCM1427320.1 hypothetical protein [Eubacterium sp.]